MVQPDHLPVTGGCHCSNIRVEIELTGARDVYHPRACDCSYCLKHGASYLSDPNGKMTIHVKDKSGLVRYRQGDKIADFLFCRFCGVLIGVCYEEAGQCLGVINSRVLDNVESFGEELSVSPQKLTDQEKIQRWNKIWFHDVKINLNGI